MDRGIIRVLASPPNPQLKLLTNVPIMKKTSQLIATLSLGLLAAGCSTTLNTPQGKILSITERGIGFEVTATDETT
jgi:hypothetical protein